MIDIYPQKETHTDQQWKSPAAVFMRSFHKTIVWGFGFSSTPEGRSAANKSNSVKVWGVRTPGGASVSRSLSCLVIKSDFSENVNEAFDSGWLLLKLCASHAVLLLLLLLPHISCVFSTNFTSSSVSAHTLSNIFSVCQKNIFIAVHAHITSVNSIRCSQLLAAAARTPYRGLLNLPEWECVSVCVVSTLIPSW